MLTVYGIPNCDTVKRARAWLDARGLAYRFHDFKRQGVPETELARWIERLGWEALLNRKGTTWRALPEAEKGAVVDAASAARLMVLAPSLVRRPVIEWPGGPTVGFDPERYGGLAAG